MTVRLAAALAVPLLAMAAMPARAQDGEDPYAACAARTDDAARLACSDSTYARQRVVIAEREEAEEREREEVFGFREEDDALENAEEDVAVTATVTEVLQGARRSQVLLLDTGQLWREINGSTMRNRVRDGWVATI